MLLSVRQLQYNDLPCGLVWCSFHRYALLLIHCFVHFEGCAAHRLNLAVQFLLQDHSQLLARVHEFMSELRSPKNCGMQHPCDCIFALAVVITVCLTANLLIQ